MRHTKHVTLDDKRRSGTYTVNVPDNLNELGPTDLCVTVSYNGRELATYVFTPNTLESYGSDTLSFTAYKRFGKIRIRWHSITPIIEF